MSSAPIWSIYRVQCTAYYLLSVRKREDFCFLSFLLRSIYSIHTVRGTLTRYCYLLHSTVRLRLRVFFRIFVLDSPICVVRCVPECGKRWRKVYCSISWRSFLSATCSDAFVSSSSARVVYSSNGSCNPGSCSDSDGMPTGSAFSGAWTPCDASRLVECPRCSPPC